MAHVVFCMGGGYKTPSIVKNLYRISAHDCDQPSSNDDMILAVFGPLWYMMTIGVTIVSWPLPLYVDF